jgi:hypothetical protein
LFFSWFEDLFALNYFLVSLYKPALKNLGAFISWLKDGGIIPAWFIEGSPFLLPNEGQY